MEPLVADGGVIDVDSLQSAEWNNMSKPFLADGGVGEAQLLKSRKMCDMRQGAVADVAQEQGLKIPRMQAVQEIQPAAAPPLTSSRTALPRKTSFPPRAVPSHCQSR